MLWQEESVGGATLYTDIFKNGKFDVKNARIKMNFEFGQTGTRTLPKRDDISDFIRRQANAGFLQIGNLEKAMDIYSEAIAASKLVTKNVGMCYANRATCCMHLKQYSLCLGDIELAKKSKYPVHLLPKLEEKKAMCMELMQKCDNKATECDEMKLDFPPNEKIPCFANAIELKYSTNGDSHIVANRNLEIGQTIIIEEPYEMVSNMLPDYRKCWNCLKPDANLIPCKNCTLVMFCSQECYDAGHKNYHDIECDMNIRFNERLMIRRLVFRTIIVAIKTFGTVDALMDAIERFNKEKKVDESNAAKQNYFKFFESRQDFDKRPYQAKSDIEFDSWVLSMYTIIAEASGFSSMFDSKKSQRFLGHLVLHHFYVIERNSIYANSLVQHTKNGDAAIGALKDTTGTLYGHAIVLNSMHMKHSCAANVARIFVDKNIIYKIIRPIKAEEELFVSYTYVQILFSFC